jgi:hypothetical protein
MSSDIYRIHQKEKNNILTMSWLNSILVYLFLFYPLVGYISRSRYGIWPAQILMVLTLPLFVLNNPIKFKFSHSLKYLALFVLYVAAQLIILGKSAAVADYKSFLTMLFLYLILANTNISKALMKDIQSISLFIIISATLVIAYQYLVNPLFLFNYIDYDVRDILIRRPMSYFGWSGTVSGGYSMPAFSAIVISEALKSNKKTKAIIVYVVGVIFSILCLSRYVMLSMLIVGSLFYLHTPEKRAFISKGASFLAYTMIVIVLVLMASSAIGVNMSDIVQNRVFEGGEEFENTSAYTRVFAFELFNQVFWEKPIFGTGGRQTEQLADLRAGRTSQIHVGWLSLFFYFGVVGAFFYIMFTVNLLKELYVTAQNTNFWGSYVAFLTYFFSVMTTGVYFDISVAGYVVAFAVHCHYKRTSRAAAVMVKPDTAVAA